MRMRKYRLNPFCAMLPMLTVYWIHIFDGGIDGNINQTTFQDSNNTDVQRFPKKIL